MHDFMSGTILTGVLQCKRIYPMQTACIRATERKAHGLVYFVDGTNEYVYDGTHYVATPGTVLYLPQGRAYEIHRQTTAQCIYIDFSTLDDPHEPPFIKHYSNDAKFRDAFLSLLSAFRRQRVGYEAETLGILYSILAMIRLADRSAYLPEARYQIILPAVEYINANFTDSGLRTEKLAALCSVSVRYFDKLFGVFFGTSPREYIIRLRLDAAQNLLVASDESISNIAAACGFSDVYYFCKLFRRRTNMTASEYRKNSENAF